MTKRPGLLIAISFLVFTNSVAQETNNIKVLITEISGNYKGDSNDGFANGKGIAKGIDTYSGEFKNGLPDGKGKYTYKNGDTFTGSWSNGLKNGKGVFNFTLGGNVMSQKGYWVNGDYVGLTNTSEPFNVTNQSGIESYTIEKTDDGNANIISFSVMIGASRIIPTDFEFDSTSGQLQGVGKTLFINNFVSPMTCSVRFTVKTGGDIKFYSFAFEITQSGKYNVNLIIP